MFIRNCNIYSGSDKEVHSVCVCVCEPDADNGPSISVGAAPTLAHMLAAAAATIAMDIPMECKVDYYFVCISLFVHIHWGLIVRASSIRHSTSRWGLYHFAASLFELKAANWSRWADAT